MDCFHKSGANVPESNCFTYLQQNGGATCCPTIRINGFAFHSLVRRLNQPQVSGGLGEQALHSHSTKLANNASQVASYVRVLQWGAGGVTRQVELRAAPLACG